MYGIPETRSHGKPPSSGYSFTPARLDGDVDCRNGGKRYSRKAVWTAIR